MGDVVDSPFPAQTRKISGLVKDVPTDVTVIKFVDKIVITITQGGRLAQWFHVAIDSPHRVISETALLEDGDEDSLLPLSHLTPVTLLGGTDRGRESTGQVIAVQIASLVSTRSRDEGRMVMCGLGLGFAELDQQSFLEVLELVGKCL